MVKPLALLPLLRRLSSPREAMLVGMLAGAGFAAVENLLYATLFGPAWGGVLAVRVLGAALHPFGAGLVAAGWWYVLHGEAGAGRRWWSRYGLAVGAHALWNGTCVVAVAVAGAWFQGWEVDLLGVTDAALLLALLAAQGAGLLVALRALARRLAAGATETEERLFRLDMPDERALAVWGLACLVVLLPVGLGLLRMIW
jgi:RsiW-degrading membrane proteinase PrsW (M82 family)